MKFRNTITCIIIISFLFNFLVLPKIYAQNNTEPVIVINGENEDTSQDEVISQIVKNPDAEKAIYKLVKLEILDESYIEEGFDQTKIVNRGQLASIAITVLGLREEMEKMPDNIYSPFKDVKSSHEYYKSIIMANRLGILTGYTDRTFKPDESVDLEQAMKVVVSLLGYGIYAQQIGGYPAGYNIIAAQLGLYKRIKVSMDKNIDIGNFAILIDNTLDADVLEQTRYGIEGSYASQKNNTLLAKYFDIHKVRGRIFANVYTRLDGKSSLNNDEVEIEGIIYKTGETEAKKLLGYNVEAYYKITDSSNMLMYVEADKSNCVIKINVDDIESYSDNHINYFNNEEYNKQSVATIEQPGVVLRNGRYTFNTDRLTEQDVMPKDGRVTLIDADGNGMFEIVIIENSITYVVNTIYQEDYNYIIKDKYRKSDISVDDSSNKKNVTITRLGRQLSIRDLKEWDILRYMKSDDGELINIIVSAQEQISGVIYEISDAGIVIDDNEYKISYYYKKALQEKISAIAGHDSDAIERLKDVYDPANYIGQEVNAYFDDSGMLVAIKPAENVIVFGYLIAISSTNSIDQKVEMKIYTPEGKMEIVTCAKKVEIDKYVRNTAEAILNSLRLDNGKYSQVIRYRLNDNEQVDFIDTVKEDRIVGDDDLRLSFGPDNYYWRSKGRVFLQYSNPGGCFAPGDTIFLTIPSEPDTADETQFRIDTKLVSDSLYRISAYNVAKSGEAPIIIIHDDSGNISNYESYKYSSSSAMIDKVTRVSSENGEELYKLYYYMNGRYMDSLCIEKVAGDEVSLIKKGYIVQFETDFRGYIKDITIIFPRIKEENPYGMFASAQGSSNSRFFAKVMAIGRESFAISIDGQLGQQAYYYKKPTILTQYDIKTDKITVTNMRAVKDEFNYPGEGSFVYLRNKDSNPDEAYIYKFD